MAKAVAYEIFGRFYDAVMGDRSKPGKYVSELIRKTKPDAKKMLELGCGTGSMLKYLQHHYDVAGLDTSRTMLSIARQKVPRARLIRQNMVGFSINDHFDVIFCVFDSINHILRFSDWKKVFASAQRHLLPSGSFIFDINTQQKLQRVIAEPPWVHPFGDNLLIMHVTRLPHDASNWNIKVFEHLKHNRYALHEENIVEVSFPLGKIVNGLKRYFADVRVIDPKRSRPSSRSERLFFIAQ